MGAKAFFSKGWPTRLGFYLGKYLPPRCAHLVASLAARALVMLKPDVYHNVYANQRHVLGPGYSESELRASVYNVFLNAVCSYYELFHNVGRGRMEVENFSPPVQLLPEAKQYALEALNSGRGVFCVGCHMSNFDLAGVALSQFMSISLQILSLADPTPGFELFNALRKAAGLMITPISPTSLRAAMARLRAGGAVLTGVDRPIGAGDEPVEFFGDIAYLPTGYIRIPLRTDALVMTAAPFYEDGTYWIAANPPLEMVRTGDKEQDIAVNLRRVLDEIEGFIRRHPDQWLMFESVWRGP